MTEKQLERWLDGGGSDLDMWTAWNNCKDWHEDVKAIETLDGQQFLVLTNGVVMMSEPAEGISWNIRLMSDNAFVESFVEFSDIKSWKLVTPRTLE